MKDKVLEELVEKRELKKFLQSLTSYQKKELEKIFASEFAWDKWCENCQQRKIYRTNFTSGNKITTLDNKLAHSSLIYIRDSLASVIERSEKHKQETGKEVNWIEILNNWQQHGYCFFYFNLGDWIAKK
jgi:hypothetical protein